MGLGPTCSLVHVCCARGRQLKQVKELEQEQEVLLQGLEMMARGRDWYQQQLQRVQERQRRLSQSGAGAVSAGTGAPGSCRTLRSHGSGFQPWGPLMALCSVTFLQDFGRAGSPRPLGRLLPKVQEVARCLGELLAAACAGTVSTPRLLAPSSPGLCPEEALLTVPPLPAGSHPSPRLALSPWLAAADHPHAERAEPAPHPGEMWAGGCGLQVRPALTIYPPVHPGGDQQE